MIKACTNNSIDSHFENAFAIIIAIFKNKLESPLKQCSSFEFEIVKMF